MSERILATIEAADYIGRSGDADVLRRHAAGESRSNGLWLLSAPALGASELLKRTYDSLFNEHGDTIPIYFAVKASDATAENCAARFLNTVISQTVAFRRRNAELLDVPNINELVELAAPEDADWIQRLTTNRRIDEESNDERAFIRGCFGAVTRGTKFFVMIDDLHEAAYLKGGNDFVEELKDVYSRANIRFVFSGRRRFLYGAAQTGKSNGSKILRLEPLNHADAGFLAENTARRFDVKINEQTRDLIARKFDGNPTYIKFLILAANAAKTDLDSFQRVEKLYTDQIFGGAFGSFYDSIFERIAPEMTAQKNLAALIYNALTVEKEKVPIETWRERAGLGDADFYRVMSLLNAAEIVRVTSNLVEAMPENAVLSDYIRARFRLESAAENRALVVGETVGQLLKRAPRLMANFYRQKSAIGLRELLSVFNCQETPVALLDYSIYKERFKGAETAEVLEILKESAETIRLPQIVYTAHTVAFYPQIEKVTEKTRSAVALGFAESAYTDDDETIWLAAEVDSKLEASKEAAEFWCDRLEMVALVCHFKKYKLWLVAPEGFTPEALEILRERNAFGSSVGQVELLIKFLNAESVVGEKRALNEYEIVVPMGDETEMIAARAVEEIARRHSFNAKAINQIKTALVEACINASEHSLSPDRKIYQKFAFEKDRIIITISNRGLRFTGKQAAEINPDEGRRGWGLKLMKSLMDEVKFEQVDDGTCISMTKYLK